MSKIVDFFTEEGTDHRERTHAGLIAMTDAGFEGCHDHIQWLFPLHEKSYHSKEEVPVLTTEDVKQLFNSREASLVMQRGYARFMKFLGLNSTSDEDNRKRAQWCTDSNHNLLRITRAIRSLRFFGCVSNAILLHSRATTAAGARKIDPNTFAYWDDALNKPMWESMTARFLKDREIRV